MHLANSAVVSAPFGVPEKPMRAACRHYLIIALKCAIINRPFGRASLAAGERKLSNRGCPVNRSLYAVEEVMIFANKIRERVK